VLVVGVGRLDGIVILVGTWWKSDSVSVSALLNESRGGDSWDAEASSTCGLV
jgi:hypothetical protein